MKNKKTVMMRIPVGVHRKLKTIKKITDCTYIWILKRAVEEYYNNLKGKNLPK